MVPRGIAIAKVTFMNLPFDPLREAILLQLDRAISARRAQGASFEALGREFGLSKEALQLVAECDDQAPERSCHGETSTSPQFTTARTLG